MLIIQHHLDRTANWLVRTQAPEGVRKSFCDLLGKKADITNNKVLAVYLRTMALSYGPGGSQFKEDNHGT